MTRRPEPHSPGSASEPIGRREGVLRALRVAEGPMTVIDLAEVLGIHRNTVRFHLDSLLSSGQVERVRATPTGPGRPPQAFRPTRGMDPTGTRNYQLLARILVDHVAAGPDPSRAALGTGRAWGEQLGQSHSQDPASGLGRPARNGVTKLVGLLSELGFEPEEVSGGTRVNRIALRNCPFLDLVESRTHVVCPIHLGLMQGVLASAGSTLTVERLDPFAEPNLCLAHLGPAPRTS